MTDPTRWLHARSDADPVERQLLESLQREGPDDAARGALWQQLAGSAAVAGLAVAAAPTAASSALATASGAKTGLGAALSALVPKALLTKVVLGLAVAGAGVSGFAVLEDDPRTMRSHTQVARVAPAAPVVQVAPVADTQVVAPPAAAEPAAPVVAERAQHASRRSTKQGERLLRESQLLTDARSALRAGDAARAELLLHRLTRELPRGELLQERQVLSIEAVSLRGDGARARKLAAAFIAKHPGSPHNLTLRRFLDAP